MFLFKWIIYDIKWIELWCISPDFESGVVVIDWERKEKRWDKNG